MPRGARLRADERLHPLALPDDARRDQPRRRPAAGPDGHGTREPEAAFESYTLALRAAKSRAFPLTVAQLLLGIAMIFFAHGASVGWAWARHALVQLLIAGIVLSGVAWVLTPDLRGPLDALQLASARLDPSEIDPTTLKAANITVLVFGMFVSAVTLLGLTLRRSRAFYEPATGLDEL